MRKILKNFENCSQPAEPVGKSDLYSFYFFGIPDSMRKILKIFITALNRLNRLGNRISQFIKFYFLEQRLRHSASFVLVLTRLES